MSTFTHPLEPGDPRRVGPYRLLGQLGQGGMGRVFLGEDAEGHRVAVKLIHEAFTADSEFRGRFRREATAAGQVLSYFTVPLVDSGPDDAVPWLATLYVPGPSLDKAVRRDGPLTVDRLCTLAAALGEALIVIHAAGIVHRDLKPSNVLLAEDGPRVIDFGIARAADSDDLTGAGRILGTFGYAPPEQVMAEEQVTAAGDVFSLGGVLLFAATGREPFGDGPPAVLAYRTVHEEPDLDGVPVELTGLIGRCLAKDPGQRPSPRQVIAEARAVQSRAQGSAPHEAAQEPTSYRLAPPIPASTLPVSAGPAPDAGTGERRFRRPRLLMATAAGLAVSALVTTALMWLPDRDGSRSPEAGKGGSSGTVVAPPDQPAQPASEGADPVPAITVAGERRRAWTALPHDDGTDAEVLAAWLTKTAVVRVDSAAVRGFDPRTGAARWTVTPPTAGMVPCGGSDGTTATSGGVGLVRFGKAHTSPALCDTVAALDTATGRLLWHRRIGEAPLALASVSGDILLVGGEEGILGLRRTTGRTAWSYRWTQADCRAREVLPGPRSALVSESCESPDGRYSGRVVELDTTTGRSRVVETADQATSVRLLEADPVVIGYEDPDSPTIELEKVRILRPDGQAPLDVSAAHPFGRFAGKDVTGEGVWVTFTEGEGRTRGLAAVDLRQGKVRWHVRPPGEDSDVTILRIQGDSLYTVEADHMVGERLSYELRRRSLATGAITESARLPPTYREGSPSRLVAAGGLLVQFNNTPPFHLAAFDTTTG
ncbi:protein kinase [Streptomyces sp. QHH-9511]|uniref:serine/threonine-protein kinase n=1 Tax=Streptomyces sp. QHH-9511 TaxID=2684468 RepID=UPI001316F5B6|nr:serine/threonine-protein kinase [Streptomyces sp. QHH-9511]QGZ47615.1 protein kinase [Streptomyces sp. QHH-9511]